MVGWVDEEDFKKKQYGVWQRCGAMLKRIDYNDKDADYLYDNTEHLGVLRDIELIESEQNNASPNVSLAIEAAV